MDELLWDEVQARLAKNRIDRRTGANATEPSLLVGLVHDETGERMTPTHANKKGTRYRYYVSKNLIQRGRPKGVEAGRRVPAGELEHLVEQRVIAFLANGAEIFDALEPVVHDPVQRAALIEEAANFAHGWQELSPADRNCTIHRLVERIDFRRDSLEIRINAGAVPNLFDLVGASSGSMEEANDASVVVLSVATNPWRAGKENKLLIEGPGDRNVAPNRGLVRLLGQAQRFQELALRGDGRSVSVLAAEVGVVPSYFTRILRLSFLAPGMVKLILDGRHPSRLTAKALTEQSPKLPNDWIEQAAIFGFA